MAGADEEDEEENDDDGKVGLCNIELVPMGFGNIITPSMIDNEAYASC